MSDPVFLLSGPHALVSRIKTTRTASHRMHCHLDMHLARLSPRTHARSAPLHSAYTKYDTGYTPLAPRLFDPPRRCSHPPTIPSPGLGLYQVHNAHSQRSFSSRGTPTTRGLRYQANTAHSQRSFKPLLRTMSPPRRPCCVGTQIFGGARMAVNCMKPSCKGRFGLRMHKVSVSRGVHECDQLVSVYQQAVLVGYDHLSTRA